MSDTVTIVHELSSPLPASLLSIHPNDVTLDGQALPSQWSSWWSWASDYGPEGTPAWLQLIHYFIRPDAVSVGIPLQLRSLVDSVRVLQLQRTPSAYKSHRAGHRSYRMSPKKAHEVDRMSAYIHHMVHSDNPRSVWHAVDVGSGQGYLSRALHELGFHVLALDNNENQTSGANRWIAKEVARRLKKREIPAAAKEPTNKSLSNHPGGQVTDQETVTHIQAECSHPQTPNLAAKGSLTHRTVHVCPQKLEDSIAAWLIDHPGTQGCGVNNDVRHLSTRQEPVPVTLVALHACGSLSVNLIRTFLSHRARSGDVERAWIPHSLVVVGCCYNLMSPSGAPWYIFSCCAKYERAKHADFPLSKPLQDMHPVPKLTIAAVHLAAQVPSQWLKGDDTIRAAELALRKVVYRALLQPILQATPAQLNVMPTRGTLLERPIQPGLGETIENRRLGKLNDKAYRDWPTFLECATDKLGVNLEAINASLPAWFTHEAARLRMESALFALQTLRCILGPLIETLILLDRRDWIEQELAEMNDCGQGVEVHLVNLFDQSTGSGRNVALVVRPTTKSEWPSVMCP